MVPNQLHKEIDKSASKGKNLDLDVDEELLLNGSSGAWGMILQNVDGPFPFFICGHMAVSMASLL
jgi:hypothetical protein